MCDRCNEILEHNDDLCYRFCPHCGEQLKPNDDDDDDSKQITYWGYMESLEPNSDEWRRVLALGQYWHSQEMDLDECIKEIIKG